MFLWIPTQSMCKGEGSIEEREHGGLQTNGKKKEPRICVWVLASVTVQWLKKKQKTSLCPPCCGTAVSKMDVCAPQDSPLPYGEKNEKYSYLHF